MQHSVTLLHKAVRDLRERFNQRRRRHALGRNPQQFNSICSAMDVVGDCGFALSGYLEHLNTAEDDKNLNYLIIYGVLNALYLQQDAVFYWGHHLRLPPWTNFSTPGDWISKGNVPELVVARSARNNATGHPVHRKRGTGVSAFFIAHVSVDRLGFDLMEARPRDRSVFSHVLLLDLIEGQVPALTKLLQSACDALDGEDREHYRKFMDKPLEEIFFKKFMYPVSKLSTPSSPSDWEVMPLAVKWLRDALHELKAAIEARNEPFGEIALGLYQRVLFALGLLEKYTADTSTLDERLAQVLCHYVRYAVNELEEIARELDKEYTNGAKG